VSRWTQCHPRTRAQRVGRGIYCFPPGCLSMHKNILMRQRCANRATVMNGATETGRQRTAQKRISSAMSKKTGFYPGFSENRSSRARINHALAVAIPFRLLRSLTVARPVFFAESCHPEEPNATCAPQGNSATRDFFLTVGRADPSLGARDDTGAFHRSTVQPRLLIPCRRMIFSKLA
jgi:hypothetical protein